MSKTTRISIYAGAPLQKYLDAAPIKPCPVSLARAGRHGAVDDSESITPNVSINRMAERYMYMLAQNLPELDHGTWVTLLSAKNSWTEHTIGEIECEDLVGLVCDDLGLDRGDDESWNDFIERASEASGAQLDVLSKLTNSQILAVIDVIERYWGRERPDPGASFEDVINAFKD